MKKCAALDETSVWTRTLTFVPATSDLRLLGNHECVPVYPVLSRCGSTEHPCSLVSDFEIPDPFNNDFVFPNDSAVTLSQRPSGPVRETPSHPFRLQQLFDWRGVKQTFHVTPSAILIRKTFLAIAGLPHGLFVLWSG